MFRVGLVGYGYSGRTFHAPLIDSVDGLALAAVVSSNRDKVHNDRPGCPVLSLAELTADPAIEVVVIATPNETHAPIARALLNAGKHVVVDKPFTTSVGEADELAAIAARQGRMLTVFHNRRWDGDFLTIRSLVADRTLGDIVEYESRAERYRPIVRDRWRERPGPGSGIWFDFGAHLVDQALQLFGQPDAIRADLAAQRGHGAIDFFHVVLRYETLRVVLRGSSLAVAGGPRFQIFGTAGSYVKFGWDTQEEALKKGERPGESLPWGQDPQSGMLAQPDGDGIKTIEVPNLPGDYRRFYEQLREALLTGTAPPVTIDETRNVMRLLEAGIASSASRCDVSLAR